MRWRQKRSTEGCSKFKGPETRTSSGKIGLNIRTHASPKVGQDLTPKFIFPIFTPYLDLISDMHDHQSKYSVRDVYQQFRPPEFWLRLTSWITDLGQICFTVAWDLHLPGIKPYFGKYLDPKYLSTNCTIVVLLQYMHFTTVLTSSVDLCVVTCRY